MPFLDPNKFTLDPQSMSSFQDRIAELRKGLPPTVQAMQPEIPGQPQAPAPVAPALQSVMGSQPEQRPSQLQAPRQQRMGLDEAAKQTAPAAPPAADPTIQQLRDTISKINPKILAQLEKEAMNLEPPKLIGVDVFSSGRGGIMGLGVEPIDVLAFALGVGATWNLPQQQAQANTFAIASWPSKYKESQREASKAYIQNAIGGLNASTAGSNAVVAQTKAAQEQQELEYRESLAKAYEAVGRNADAAALRAGTGGVSAHIALTGKEAASADRIPANLYAALEGISTGVTPLNAISPNIANLLGNPKTIEEAQSAATVWLAGNAARQPAVSTPTSAAVRTPGGPIDYRDLPAYLAEQRANLERVRSGQPAVPVAPSLPVSPKLQQQQQQQQQQPIVPPTTLAPPAPKIPLAPTVPGGAAPLPTSQQGQGIIERLSQSPNPADQKRAAALADMPPETRSRLDLLYAQKLPEQARQQLIAQLSTKEYADELEQYQQRMVDSYAKLGKSVPNQTLKLALAEIRKEIPDDAWLITRVAANAAGHIMQRRGNFTPEAVEFTTKLAQAQRFAKGSLNDAANLANAERKRFDDMIGSLWDTPAFFAARTRTFQRDISKMYNQSLKDSGLFNTKGFELMTVPSEQTVPRVNNAPAKQQVITDPKELGKWLDLGPNGPVQRPAIPGEQY